MKQIEQSIDVFFAESKRDLENAIKKLVKDKKMLRQLEGGKRLRPILSLLSFKACTTGKETPKEYQRALDGAVSIELAHTSSLIFDDIIDNEIERRGKPALYIEEGIGPALLIGQKMLALSCKIAVDHGVEFAQLYADTWNQAVSGELLELDLNQKKLGKLRSSSKLFSFYLSVIDLKTASLFASACRAGALEAHAESEIVDLLTEYGREVGRAYQLADDLVDLERGELLNSVVLPILSRVESKNKLKLDKDLLRRKIEEHKEEIKNFYISEIKNRLKKAEVLIKNSTLPNSTYKEMLASAPRYLINKMVQSINMVI